MSAPTANLTENQSFFEESLNNIENNRARVKESAGIDICPGRVSPLA
jgi:hypothetical protein